jgi:hypothetical protein
LAGRENEGEFFGAIVFDLVLEKAPPSSPLAFHQLGTIYK